ncbi:MAG: PDZ domain-containing protein [Phycisphaeraceae bacterium]|nr:PDZ domain-containing protein [Phycisphaeraceae bacterium]
MNLLLETNGPRASQRRMLVGLAASMGLACGCGLAGAQQTTTVRPAAPAAPAPPAASPADPPAPSALAPLVYLSGNPGSTHVFRSVEDGRTIELRLVNNRVDLATVNGVEVPEDRIIREGRSIVLKGADGTSLFTYTIPEDRAIARARIGQGLSGQFGSWSGSAPARDKFALEAAIIAEPLPVMLGVSMIEPDATLRGHLGIEPGTATLVSAVYDEMPAAAAGIEPYDVIVSIDGRSPASPDDVRRVLREKKPGDEMNVGVIHRGQKREVVLKLEKYDAERFKAVKVRAIAAAEGQDSVPGIGRFLGHRADDEQWPFRGTMLGRAGGSDDVTIFLDPATLADQQARIAELQRRADEQAARARELTERLVYRATGDAAAGGRAAEDVGRALEDRLRKLEEMMLRLLEERGAGNRGGAPTGGGNPTPPPFVSRNPDA